MLESTATPVPQKKQISSHFFPPCNMFPLHVGRRGLSLRVIGARKKLFRNPLEGVLLGLESGILPKESTDSSTWEDPTETSPCWEPIPPTSSPSPPSVICKCGPWEENLVARWPLKNGDLKDWDASSIQDVGFKAQGCLRCPPLPQLHRFLDP